MSTGGMLPVGGIDSVIPRNIEKHLCAIRLCMANQLTVPAIILIYTGIDFLASLTRPEGQQEVKSDDFIRWAEQYMSCKETLGVRGIDLYAARCGVVHSYRISSRLYRRAKANRIAYAWGRKEAGPADLFLKEVR